MLGIASVGALRKLRADIRAQGPSAARAPPPTPTGPKPKTPSGIEYIKHPAVRSYSVPFPGLHPSHCHAGMLLHCDPPQQ